jgi:ketosteroid isomerase-like protein
VAGDRGIAQWTNAGVTRSGREYANRGVTIFTFDTDGRCTRIQDYLDTERIAETWPARD